AQQPPDDDRAVRPGTGERDVEMVAPRLRTESGRAVSRDAIADRVLLADERAARTRFRRKLSSLGHRFLLWPNPGRTCLALYSGLEPPIRAGVVSSTNHDGCAAWSTRAGVLRSRVVTV